MIFTSRLVSMAAIALLLPAAGALAADYDPPIIVEDAVVDYAPEVPVEIGTGWYLRGDVSYNLDWTYSDSSRGIDFDRFTERSTPVSATVGFGYHLTDFLRVEANVGLLSRQTSELDFADPMVTVVANTNNTMWSGMVSAYGDLGTYVGFTPYVGAGVGLVMSKREYTAVINGGANDFVDSGRNFSFAYSVGGGVAYEFSKNLSLDVGYQYLSAPNAEYAEIVSPTTYAIREGFQSHQVKVGLRYDLW